MLHKLGTGCAVLRGDRFVRLNSRSAFNDEIYNLVDLTIDFIDRSQLMKLLISINMLAISITDLFGWELVSFAWEGSTKPAPKSVAPLRTTHTLTT